MARVPTASPTTAPQQGPTVFQDVRATPDAFGAQIGRAQESSGAQLSQFANDQIDREIAKQIQRNDTENKTLLNEFNQGLSAIEQEYKDLKGMDAVEKEQEFTIRIQELKEELRGTASNDKILEMFDLASSTYEVNSQERIQNRARIQGDEAQKNANAAYLENSLERAAEFSDNDEYLAVAISDAEVVARSEAERQGATEVEINEAGESARSEAWRRAIEANIAKRKTSLAQDMFNNASEQGFLEGPDIVDLQKMLNDQIDLDIAFLTSDKIINDNTDNKGRINKKGVLSALKKIKDSRIRKDATIQARQAMNDQAAAEAEQVQKSAGELSAFIAQGGSKAEWVSQNPNEWALIQENPDMLRAIQAHEVSQANEQEHVLTNDGTLFREFFFMVDEDIIAAISSISRRPRTGRWSTPSRMHRATRFVPSGRAIRRPV